MSTIKTAFGVEDLGCRRVAVIGAGNMGGGIAAQFANAGIAVDLLDRAGPDGVRDAPAEQGLAQQIARQAFMGEAPVSLVRVGNTEDHLERVAEADWIVEVILEDLDLKRALYERIEPLRKPDAIVSSNTSTILRGRLIEGRGAAFQDHFLISHFFNPPRRMALLELIGSEDRVAFDRAAEIGRKALGKTVIECRDTPGFIANRLGCTWLSVAVVEALRLGLTVEEADAVHMAFGVPRTGVFGLLDLVGLDVVKPIWGSLMAALPRTDAINAFDLPGQGVITDLVSAGRFGRKSRAGFFRKSESGALEALDLNSGVYRAHSGFAQKDLPGAGRDLDLLLNNDTASGAYARAVLAQVVGYALTHAGEIAPSLKETDLGMELGYAWRAGPVALWRELSPETQARLRAQMPEGVPFEALATPVVRSGEADRLSRAQAAGQALAQNSSAALWDLGDDVICLDIRSKMHALGPEVFDILEEGVSRLNGAARGMVVGNHNPRVFSAGADLSKMVAWIEGGKWAAIEAFITRGQMVLAALRTAHTPSVAAMHGLALGGGCELAMHCTGTVAHAETRIGLPEHLVGLVPGWGGCRRLLDRARATASHEADLSDRITRAFHAATLEAPAGSAREAGDLALLDPSQPVVMHDDDVFAAALAHLDTLEPRQGAQEVVTLRLDRQAVLSGLLSERETARDEGRITPNAFALQSRIAEIFAAGGAGTSEADLAALESEVFMALVATPETLARIGHMLRTGKPLH